MSATDRTLLARLGFSDPDKRNPLHDLACQYLALPEQSAVLCSRLISVQDHDVAESYGSDESVRGKCSDVVVVETTSIEAPISKGQGQYRTTIGFLDVWLSSQIKHTFVGVRHKKEWTAAQGYQSIETPYTYIHTDYVPVAIEVKIVDVPLGDILRQLKLYREYVQAQRWLLVTAFDITETMRATLTREGIFFLKLGDRFHRWAGEQKTAVMDEI